MPLTVIDNAKLADVTGSQSTQIANVVDLQPLLRNGDYRCQGNDTLVVTPSGSGAASTGGATGTAAGPAVVWTFARV